ncbi:hypothetical protein HZP75_17540 [Elizabethkingia anophelis]|nr:hypothetical protein [Elizabethkingia anophelis]MCT3932352.1 hypothetical protein [Elizabethkingia anophelis]MCT4113779.1 hypothetical protein [Elizabethkingia anophelis]
MNYKKLNKKINFLLDIHDSYGIYKDKNGVVKNITKENLYSEIENLKSNKASNFEFNRQITRLKSNIYDLKKQLVVMNTANNNKIDYLGLISFAISVAAILILLLR